VEDGVSCVPVIVKRCMEGWRASLIVLGCEEEDWLAGLCPRVGLEPACTPLPKIIAGRVAVCVPGVAVGDGEDGASWIWFPLIRERMGQKEGGEGFVFENTAALREV
jgi:hypothetical protein